jgi:peptidoglycan/LPS O-acetylase OafA/YrhL
VLERAQALYPPFFLISLTLFVCSFIYPSARTRSPYSVSDIIANLLLVSEYIGKPWMSRPMWFLPFVLQIYMAIPFLKSIRVRWLHIPVSFVISGAACVVVYVSLPDNCFQICREWSPIFRAQEVMIGCCVALSATSAAAVRQVASYLLCCLIYAAAALVFQPMEYTLLLPLRGFVVFAVLFGLVSALAPLLRGRRMANFIALLGRASFPFFLAHGSCMVLIFKTWANNPLAWAVYYLLCWAGSIFCVLLIQRLSFLYRGGGGNTATRQRESKLPAKTVPW